MKAPKPRAALVKDRVAVRKPARRRRTESDEKFRCLADAARDSIVMIDAQGRVTYWNPAAEALFGYTAKEAIGSEIDGWLVAERFRDEMREGLARFAETGKGPVIGRILDVAALRKDGREVPLELSVAALRLQDAWHAVGIMRDISERKRTEETLRTSQAMLATAEGIAEIGSWDSDLVSDTTTWSEQLYRIFGRAPKTSPITYEDFVGCVHADDRARVSEAVEAVLANGEFFDMEFRVSRPDGTERVIGSRGQVFRDQSGAPVRMVGTVHDITERKRIEETLAESEARYRALFETSPDAVVVWDMDGFIRACNERAVVLLGCESAKEMIGRRWQDYIVPEDRRSAVEDIENSTNNHGPAENDFRMRRKDGSIFFAEGRAKLVLDAAGKPLYFIGAARDVTGRKKAEQALRTSRAMLATAESIAEIGSWQWDLAGNAHIWSDEQYRILGRTAKASPPTFEDFLAAVHPEDRLRVQADAEAVRADDSSDEIEFRIVRPNGDERIIHGRKQVYRDDDGRPVRLVGTIQDVTDRRRRERELSKLQTERVETIEKLQRRQQEMLLINELNETMQTCDTREEAYPLIAATAEELFPKANGAFAISVGQDHALKTFAEWGGARSMAPDFALDDCWALRRGHLHELAHPGKGARCRHFISPPPGPYLCLPLTVHGELLGLLHFNVGDDDHIDEDLRRLVVMFGEMVKLSLANLKLRETLSDQAIHDRLTGLFNRQYLDETLTRELHRAQRQKSALSVAMIDVDRFKVFNDTYGHEAGDEVLKELANLLRQGVRASDMVCRYGGEEFILVLVDTDAAGALPRLEDISRAIKAKRYEYRGIQLPAVTVSVGLAQLPVQGATAESLIRASDEALYAAKNGGRDRIEVFAGPRQPGQAAASAS